MFHTTWCRTGDADRCRTDDADRCRSWLVLHWLLNIVGCGSLANGGNTQRGWCDTGSSVGPSMRANGKLGWAQAGHNRHAGHGHNRRARHNRRVRQHAQLLLDSMHSCAAGNIAHTHTRYLNSLTDLNLSQI